MIGHTRAALSRALGCIVALASPLVAQAQSPAPLVAVFDYELPARFQVPPLPAPESTASEPTRYFSGPVRPDRWRVELDACASTGAIASYEWTIDGIPLASSASCDGTHYEALSEGAHQVGLRIRAAAGATASVTRSVLVQDWLIVGLGDSYGSGEGAPDEAVSQLALETVEALRVALEAAEQVLAQRATAYVLAEQDLLALLPLVNTAISRYNEWVAAARAVDDNCGNFTPILCAQAEAAFVVAGARLTASLVPLGLETLFGNSTLVGVLQNLRQSVQHAFDLAKAARDAALAARDAARTSFASAWAQIGPRWQDRRCHRSARSGQVQAAKRLEEADPHTSVTFIHLACSGAKIWTGLLEGYEGAESADPDLPAQIEAAAELTADREVDGLVVSIGGNDVGFAKVIESCITSAKCFDEPSLEDPSVQAFVSDYCAPLGPFAPFCTGYFDELYGSNPGNANRLFRAGGDPLPSPDDHRLGLDDLPANFAALHSRLESLAVDGDLTGVFEPRGSARVYLTAYPAITRREPSTAGAPTEVCGFDPLAPLSGRLKNLPGVRIDEILWAENIVTPQLAGAMGSSALAHGWSFVNSHVTAFDGHGYCADQNWIVRIPDSIRAQARPSFGTALEVLLNSISGSVHPTATGQQAYAAAIFGELLCDLYPGCDPSATPRAPRKASRPIHGTKLVIKDVAGKPAKRKITLSAKSAFVETPTPGAGDPTQLGAVLRIANPRPDGDDAIFVLPADGWRGLGKPAGSKGYKYTDRKRSRGPCTSVEVKPGKSLSAACKGASIPLTLDESSQSSFGVSLTLGDDPTQCMDFGGTVTKDRAATEGSSGVFHAKQAPLPAKCPLP